MSERSEMKLRTKTGCWGESGDRLVSLAFFVGNICI